MEVTVVSVAKSVLDGALSSAKSAVAEEVSLQLGVQRDLAFIKDEFEMMQTFLMAADEKRSQEKVVKTWVKQVRDLAYDVEDCLLDFAVDLQKKPPWWRFPRMLRARHRIAMEIKELKARVDDVSQRNLRYCLVSDGHHSKPAVAAAAEQYSIRGMTAFGDDDEWGTARPDQSKVDLIQLISSSEKALRVISVCGESDIGRMSIIREAYNHQKTKENLRCRAWVKVKRPFNPDEFIRSLVRQFYSNSTQESGNAQEATVFGIEIMNKMDEVSQECLIKEEFARHVNEKRYLIVLDDLYALEEWDWIRTYLPDRDNGSRIVVSTQHHEIAQLCLEQPVGEQELKNVSYGHPPVFLLFKEGLEKNGSDPTPVKHGLQPNLQAPRESLTMFTNEKEEEGQSASEVGREKHGLQPNSEASGDNSTMFTNDIEGGQSTSEVGRVKNGLQEGLIGRKGDESELIEQISLQSKGKEDQPRVIVVFGIGGVGKTALVRSIYQSQKLSNMFEKRAWVSVRHPFNGNDFSRSLDQLLTEDSNRKNKWDGLNMQLPRSSNQQLPRSWKQFGRTGSKLPEKTSTEKISNEHGNKKHLIVLDDISSYTEYDFIMRYLLEKIKGTQVIIITTREASLASYSDYRYQLHPLKDESALELFKKKVSKEREDFKLNDDLLKEGKVILKKCGGLPLAIATIGGLLATRPQDPRDWKSLSNHISAELTNNPIPRLEKLQGILTSTYEGLPYALKSCFLYLSIFPEDGIIRRRRLVRRWIAEGYSREKRGMTVEEVAEKQFTDLINRSMIQPSQSATSNSGKIHFCEVQNLMHEISISKSQEENLVLVLDKDEHCTLQPKHKIRHLVVRSGWNRDQKKNVLGSIVDVSHIRSLTVFGEWRSFFISKKMRLLRVLDLEDTEDLQDHDLVPIGNLRHLKYLSLRGCAYIYHLPGSFRNLSDLETLDIRDTFVITLPASIVKLPKLKYLRAGLVPDDEDHSWEDRKIDQPFKKFGLAAYKSYVQKKSIHDLDALPYLCFEAGVWLRGWDLFGVKVPRGIGRLEALHTLGVVNISRGKAMLKELKKLTQLRKLGVTGINKKNCKELSSAIANLGRLRSLSMRAEGEPGLEGCLDDLSPPPNDLQSLKLYGKLVTLPTWIEQIEQVQMLAKLTLRSTQLEHDAMTALGKLPNLAILRLHQGSFKSGELHLRFLSGSFANLAALELEGLGGLKSVEFEEKATPKLELLRVLYCFGLGGGGFPGIPFLPCLKEVSLRGREETQAGLRDQVAEMKKQNKLAGLELIASGPHHLLLPPAAPAVAHLVASDAIAPLELVPLQPSAHAEVNTDLPPLEPVPTLAAGAQSIGSTSIQPPPGDSRPEPHSFKLAQFIPLVTKGLVSQLLHSYKRRPISAVGAKKKRMIQRRIARLACKGTSRLIMKEKAQNLLKKRLSVPVDNAHGYLQLFDGPLTEDAIKTMSALAGLGVEDYRLPITVFGLPVGDASHACS